MKTIWLFSFIIGLAISSKGQTIGAEDSIRKVLSEQVIAWNNGNVEEFMKGYWKSDSILFIGKKIVSGWNATLERYRKTYPNKAMMGKLRFQIFRVQFLSKNACLVTGQYFLTREKDNPEGIFTLVFRKIGGRWLVVYDHTS